MGMKRFAMMTGAAAAFAVATPAYAACGMDGTAQPSSWTGDATARVIPIDYESGEGIVGMWSVQFLVNGGLFDFGYQQWHSDHTEILNSGTRQPATENFCLGVWARNGGRYVLNHYALSYDFTTGKLNGRVNIREEVGLDRGGDTFSGNFLLTVVDPTRNTVVQQVRGTVTGKRITVNTGLVP